MMRVHHSRLVLTVVFAIHGFAQCDCYLKQTSVLVGLKLQFTDTLGPCRFDRCSITDIRIGRSLVKRWDEFDIGFMLIHCIDTMVI